MTRAHWFRLAVCIIALAAVSFRVCVESRELYFVKQSDRGPAVEAAADRLLRGHSPWESMTHLAMPITTGPVPVIAGAALRPVLGPSWLYAVTLGWWAAAMAVAWRISRASVPLVAFAVVFAFGVDQRHRHEEIAFPLLLLVAAVRWPRATWTCVTLAVLSRPCWAFGGLALLAWRPQWPTWRQAAVALALGLLAALVTAAPDPHGFIAWTRTAGGMFAPWQLGLALAGVTIVGIWLRLLELPHPWWHVSAAMALAFWPRWYMWPSYSITAYVPLLWALAWATKDAPRIGAPVVGSRA